MSAASDFIDEMEAAFADAIDGLADAWDGIATQLEGNPTEFLEAYRRGEWERLLAEELGPRMDYALEKAVDARGSAEADGIGFRFDLENPDVVELLRSQRDELISDLSQETSAIIRRAIEDGYRNGIGASDLGRQISDLVGLQERQAVAIQRRRLALEEDGYSFDRIEKEIEKQTERMIRYRGQLIARTELQEAMQGATFEAWKQGLAGGNISGDAQKEWVATRAPSKGFSFAKGRKGKKAQNRTCSICGALYGQTVSLHDYFQSRTGVLLLRPPAHPACRCTMKLHGYSPGWNDDEDQES